MERELSQESCQAETNKFLQCTKKSPSYLVPILLRKSAIFRCPLCAQLFLCLCFPKVVIFDFHFSTMNDDLYGQVESKSSLWYKNQTIWLKNGQVRGF